MMRNRVKKNQENRLNKRRLISTIMILRGIR